MADKKLDPSIEQFKTFVKKNPKIMNEVKNGKTTLQQLYEDWYLLGEEDKRWDHLRSEQGTENMESEKKTDLFPNMLEKLKKMDPNQMQNYVGQLSQALGAIQGVLSQFQSVNNKSPVNSTKDKPNNPFLFRKD